MPPREEVAMKERWWNKSGADVGKVDVQ